MRISLLVPLIAPNCPPDLIEHIHGHRAGGFAQVMQDDGGGKLDDTGEVHVLQIVSRVQTAAGENGILDAGGQEVSESHLQIEVIELLQQAILYVIGEVLQMIPVDLVYGAAHLLHEHPAKPIFMYSSNRSGLRQTPKPVEMIHPIGRAEIRVGDGVAAVDEAPVAHIDTHMGGPVGIGRVIGADKEHQITGLRIGGGHRGAYILQSHHPSRP